MPSDNNSRNRDIWMNGPLPANKMIMKNATIFEGLSKITETTIEFLSPDRSISLDDIIGEPIQIVLQQDENNTRSFEGICVSVEYVGDYEGSSLFVAEVRSWLWFLNRTHENRIFQKQTTIDIIMSILGDYGFTSEVSKRLTATYEQREYCVQYDETDFDFISRLMAEEGIYFMNESGGARGKLKLIDDSASHEFVSGNKSIEFNKRDSQFSNRTASIFEWNEVSQVTSGKVVLKDYDFKVPSADGSTVSQITKGQHSYKNYSLYHYPTRSNLPAERTRFARVRMEAEAVRHKTMRGMGNVRNLVVGARFQLTGHERALLNQEHLVIGLVHHFEVENEAEDTTASLSLNNSRIARSTDFNDRYRCEIEVLHNTEQFRAPFVTPWPKISGVQTAIVTGPSGEEIHTDQHGRVKVQFFWDRLGTNDEQTSCFIRCAMPWTGRTWGMVGIPRIGQEVVVQFEDGNPDRPIVTGMLYNADMTPPYTLPANATQTGVKTRSTKSGSAETYNELVFEDKKDEEFVRLQSEKDFTQIIKNNATITIGAEKRDNGDLTQSIYGHKTETLETGDHRFTVSQGNQTIAITGDHEETIEGQSKQTITGDTVQIVKTGDVMQTINTGSLNQLVKKGSTHVVGKNYDLKAKEVIIEATTSINFKVGSTTVSIGKKGVTITGNLVKLDGKASVEVAGPKINVKAKSMLELLGAMVKIN